MPEPLIGTEPLQHAWSEMQVNARRVRRLVAQRAGRCERLMAALERAPGFVAADPWAAQLPVPDAAAGAGARTAQGRALRELGARPDAPMVLHGIGSPKPSARAASGVGAARRSASQMSPSWPARADVQARALPSAFDQVLQSPRSVLPGAAAAAVSQAMARHAPASDARAVDSGLTLGDLLPVAKDDPVLPARGVRRPSGARLAAGAPNEEAPEMPADLARGATRLAAILPTAPDNSVASSALKPAAELLQMLLPEIAPGATRPAANDAPVAAAPRAASRLLPNPATAATPTARSPAPSQAKHTPADTDEATAQAINRLLIDQAWLRGVDFT